MYQGLRRQISIAKHAWTEDHPSRQRKSCHERIREESNLHTRARTSITMEATTRQHRIANERAILPVNPRRPLQSYSFVLFSVSIQR